MIKLIGKISIQVLLVACAMFVISSVAAGQRRSHSKNKPRVAGSQEANAAPATEAQIIGKKIHFVDGGVVQADSVWQQGGEYWYQIGSVTQRVSRAVKSVETIRAPVESPPTNAATPTTADSAKPATPDSLWILLKGGARMKVDEVTEGEDGAWCRLGNYSVLIAKDRIDRIERDSDLANQPGSKRDWTTGNAKLDQLIRSSGSRFSVDPYLVFCVMEHESQFRAKAISPKGAQGLMQLMPGTAARFGVSNPYDPAQNIAGGTQYLKELLTMFGGRIDLALASYNAGEGAVLKYGSNVPPYRETREYVQVISRRYGAVPTEKRRPASPSN